MSLGLRRLRAALMLSLLWACLMGAVGVCVGVWLTTVGNRYPIFPDVGQWWFEWHDTVLRTAGTWLIAGAVLGLAFAGIVAVAERGHAMHQLRRSRLATWGAAAGLLFAFTGLGGMLVGRWFELQLLIAGLSGLPRVLVALLGAACAGLTMWVAGHATPRPGPGALRSRTDAPAALVSDPTVPPTGRQASADALTRR